MKKIVLSGGPGTGKSTLFELLKTAYPTAYFIDEAAEKVIKQELAKQSAQRAYEPKIPSTNYKEFAQLLTKQELKDETSIPNGTELVFMDRCLIDNVGFLLYNDYIVLFRKFSNILVRPTTVLHFFVTYLVRFSKLPYAKKRPNKPPLYISKYLMPISTMELSQFVCRQ